MLRYLFVVACLSVYFSNNGRAQDSDEPVSVIHFFNERTMTYDIYCENLGPDNYTIELDFETLTGLRPNTPYPLRKTIAPGRELVMKLTQHNLESRGHFKIDLTYRRGQLTYEFDEKFPYLIPLKANTMAQPFCSDSLHRLYAPRKHKPFYVYGFIGHPGDTIYASRKGVVSKIQKNIPEANYKGPIIANYLDIQHKDGSYGRYEGIDENNELVLIGDKVEAGDPIAVLHKPRMDSTSFFTFRTFYYSDKLVTSKVGPSNTIMTTSPIRFQGFKSSCTLDAYKKYEVCHPEETIFLEMSKRDIRKWKKEEKGERGSKMEKGWKGWTKAEKIED